LLCGLGNLFPVLLGTGDGNDAQQNPGERQNPERQPTFAPERVFHRKFPDQPLTQLRSSPEPSVPGRMIVQPDEINAITYTNTITSCYSQMSRSTPSGSDSVCCPTGQACRSFSRATPASPTATFFGADSGNEAAMSSRSFLAFSRL